MRLSVPLIALASALTGALASDVVDLTLGSFPAEVLSEDLALVEFFAPWCGHCKNLAPHYEEAATELKASKGIKLAKVDCTAEQALCAEYGVNGYPTLKVFRHGVPADYTGPRKADGIVSYMVKQSLPAVTELTPDTHDEFTKMDKVVVIAYGDVPKAFFDYANTARDTYLFGHASTSSRPSTVPGSSSDPAIVLYKSFDEGRAVLGSGSAALNSLDAADIGEWVKTEAIPLFAEIGPENFGAYAEQGVPIAYLFADPAAAGARDALIAELADVAKELRGHVSFVYIDGVKFKDHGKSLGVTGDLPQFVIQDLAAQVKYAHTGAVDAAGITQFARDVYNGKVEPTIKSEPKPASQSQPIYHLTADGWNDLFDDESKDVFAEFFAPWCGHCQRLAPIWETLGERYAANANVVIAQMDATENDIPPAAPFRVQGFPTLKFRPAGQADFIDYNGDRSLESLVEFVETHRQSGAGTGYAARNVSDAADDFEQAVEDDEESLSTHEHDEL
ncbi:protein disulfide-isomerase precursor [Cryptotrichosporon argae]